MLVGNVGKAVRRCQIWQTGPYGSDSNSRRDADVTSLASLTGARAIFSIAALSRGRAPLAVCLAVFLLGFAALEIRAQEEPTRLDELVVSDGQVRFRFLLRGAVHSNLQHEHQRSHIHDPFVVLAEKVRG